MDWYDDKGVNRLDRPVLSSNLNLIENLWDEIDHQIKGRSNHPRSVKEIRCLLQAHSPQGGTTAYQLLSRSINPQVTNMVAKYDVNLALSSIFRYVFIESPL
ncbi:hypothetical protein TNCV_1440571 [Trichonephila clavipes]|nr:hypothetical protein TNCV_1440571 [Trichonephila clavipes]